MNEVFLHYVWKHRLLENNLFTTEGQPVVIERTGDLNVDAGPDFFNAHIRIGDTFWVGNVEIHVNASDWNLHKHFLDKKYNNVILHVVYQNDKDVFLENGQSIATIELKNFISKNVWKNYQELITIKPSSISCMEKLPQISPLYIHSLMERLAAERIENKSKDVKRLLNDAKGSWADCCYWLLARYFGGKINAMPFEMLAKSIHMQLFAKMKDDTFRIEALLFGQAGMLEASFLDDYPNALKKEYEYIRKAYQLTPIENHIWKFFRVRPYSFPTLRISQLASLIASSSNLFPKLLQTSDVKMLFSYFDVSTSEYWKTHYYFDKESKAIVKSVGNHFVTMLIINAWVPLLFEYGIQHGSQLYKDRAIQLLEQFKYENNHVIRKWMQLGVSVDNALQSQALLELYHSYCERKRCLDCQIGYTIMKKEIE